MVLFKKKKKEFGTSDTHSIRMKSVIYKHCLYFMENIALSSKTGHPNVIPDCGYCGTLVTIHHNLEL